MKHRLRKICLLLLACAWPASAVSGSDPEVVAVLSSSLQFYRTAFESFQQSLGQPVSSFTLPSDKPRIPSATRVVVAFGARAALQDYPDNDVLVYGMAPGVRIASGQRRGASIKIAMTPRADDLLLKLKELQPGLARLAVFWVSEESAEYIRDLERKSAARGVSILVSRLAGAEELPARLREWEKKPDALWLPPDPLLVNAESFAILKEYSWSQKVPLFAASEGFAEKGATASISVSFEETGRAAAAAAAQALAGTTPERVIHPDRITTTVNPAAAAACGLAIPPEALRKADKILPMP